MCEGPDGGRARGASRPDLAGLEPDLAGVARSFGGYRTGLGSDGRTGGIRRRGFGGRVATTYNSGVLKFDPAHTPPCDTAHAGRERDHPRAPTKAARLRGRPVETAPGLSTITKRPSAANRDRGRPATRP